MAGMRRRGPRKGDLFEASFLPFLGGAGGSIGALPTVVGIGGTLCGLIPHAGLRAACLAAAGAVGGAISKIPPVIAETAGKVATAAGAAVAGGVLAGTIFDMLGGGNGRRRRRMNPLNPKALRRSMRRIDRFNCFVKDAKRLGSRRCGSCRR
jgi:hypothetical protein